MHNDHVILSDDYHVTTRHRGWYLAPHHRCLVLSLLNVLYLYRKIDHGKQKTSSVTASCELRPEVHLLRAQYEQA